MRTASALIVLTALQAACSAGGPLKATTTSSDSVTAPKPFVQLVEARWKGARLTSRATTACSAGAEAPGADATRAYLAGDFDGDGATDVAAPVTRGDGLHLVAGLRHTYDYTVMDVTGAADASADRFTVRPRGTLYKVPGSDVDYYFGADTIVATPCGGAPTAYLWNGTGFEPRPLAE